MSEKKNLKQLDYLLLNLKDYAAEPNVPDYSGEYPPPMEWEQGEVQLLLDYINELQVQLQQKENIIKEVREYIKENSIYYPTSDGCQWVDQFKVLEILDKENKYGIS